ncbi:MAG: AMP-binding protein, partial [Streptosporangiales bacterium]|nr:AMP-binding protein [Streptosporangiales bacterium]
MFADRAREHPDAAAVRGPAGSATYGHLNAAADHIAWWLRELNAATTVGVGTTRGPAMIAAVLGVLKSGRAYVPVEPSLPAERAAEMLTRTGADVLITGPDGTRPPPGVTPLDITHGLPDTHPDGPPPYEATPDDTAYVIFTSGSTGRPKGVAVSHRAVAALIDWARRTFAFGPSDLGLAVTSLGFDLSVFDIFGLLGCGAEVYVADEEQRRDPALLLDILTGMPVTFWNSAPTTLAQLSPFPPGRGSEHLRLVFLSGDYTPLSLPGELRA